LSGYAYRAIQEIIGVTPGFIAKWKKEFISAGMDIWELETYVLEAYEVVFIAILGAMRYNEKQIDK